MPIAPPNHFLRWIPQSLQAAIKVHGFSELPIQRETPTVAYTAAQINNRFGSGISHSLAPELPHWFCDEIQKALEQKAKPNGVQPSLRARAVGPGETRGLLSCSARRYSLCKMARFVGPYLYCLARRLD